MPGPARAAHLSPWGRLVAACALVVAVAAAVLLIWSLTSSQRARGLLLGAGAIGGVSLDLGDADVEVAGGGRRDRGLGAARRPLRLRPRAGRRPRDRRRRLRVRSRCPSTVLHGCSVRYRVVVPDNIPLVGPDRRGLVTLPRLPRLGAGHDAAAATSTSPASAASRCRRAPTAAATSPPATACPPPQLALRSTTGRGPRAGAARAATSVDARRARRAATPRCAA